MQPLLPDSNVPDLSFDLVSGKRWELSEQKPEHFTLIVFYRGLHCPKCLEQLEKLNAQIANFEKAGVNVVAVSMDDYDRAEKTVDGWDLKDLSLGYGLSESTIRKWGLFLSLKMERDEEKLQEPQIFSEPGIFLVRPDGLLYSSSIQTMPFARPHFEDILNAIQFITANNYPARGTLQYS